ncbi:efflux transporter outer membrane subunit [Pseudoduganella lurida]|nr:efflux transporter outer membrane subunit [Pseudoduganella lurida]
MTKSLTCVAVMLLAGCATVPPDHHVLARRDVAADLPSSIHLAAEGWPDANWWQAWHDPQLDALIAGGLKGAPSLDVAATQIGAARAALSRTHADTGLSTALTASASRQRYSGTGLFPAPIGGAYYTGETVRVEARYDFDWWGRNRAQIAAAAGEVNARNASYAAAEQALAAAIAQSYFSLQGDWARHANLEQLIATQRDRIATYDRRVARGLGNSLDRQALENDLTLMEKRLAEDATAAAQEREALRALLGAGNAALADLKPVPLQPTAHALPARLGIELLARRPDLQAARWRVEAALSRIDAARAAFYPDVNLTGAVGLDTVSLSHLLEANSRTLFVGPALTVPLFDSRRLSAQLEGARSERNELVAEYNQAVVNAVRDAAQDGAALQGIEAQLERQARADAGAAALLAATETKLARGLADRAALLDARAGLLRQRDDTLALHQLQALAEVALIRSLGGGWQAAPARDTTAPIDASDPAPATMMHVQAGGNDHTPSTIPN